MCPLRKNCDDLGYSLKPQTLNLLLSAAAVAEEMLPRAPFKCVAFWLQPAGANAQGCSTCMGRWAQEVVQWLGIEDAAASTWRISAPVPSAVPVEEAIG